MIHQKLQRFHTSFAAQGEQQHFRERGDGTSYEKICIRYDALKIREQKGVDCEGVGKRVALLDGTL